ncbi:MAG: nucleotidyl transferase AbiEii/AbiGii toxin family protein [Dialister sp.]|nr:nucleotidyl transferase AbiEii/AbiGii toxin family protein [Dialister sp.]
MNKAKLTALCHKISKEKGLSFNSVMTYYFLEALLKRLAESPYHDHFVFKGGFLLSNVLGIETRSTVDIDFLLHHMELSQTQLKEIFTEILTGEQDGIRYEMTGISPIREDDAYGGFRVQILCHLENIRQTVPLDIATGDVITPGIIDYSFESLFDKEVIPLKAYPIETVLAEKLETIYKRGFLNSRSKDYYDLHLLYRLKKDQIDFGVLREACQRTFAYRGTEFDVAKIKALLSDLRQEEVFIGRFKAYARRNAFVRATFEETVDSALELLNGMEG